MLSYLKNACSISLILFAAFSLESCQTNIQWPEESVDTKPGTRWWWMGSAVDKTNLSKNMEAYADAGIGSLEITPIYGIQGNDSNEIDFLSDKWMQMYIHSQQEALRLGMKIDMNTGTGWPFGGPDITPTDAASKLLVKEFNLSTGERLKELIIPEENRQKEIATLACLMAFSEKGEKLDLTNQVSQHKLHWQAPKGKWKLIALFEGNTFQQVKRAAPGGKGLVLNHFSEKSVLKYLHKFTHAFKERNAPVPNYFFNDSYEVYQADWTPHLLTAFEKMQGYRLQDYLPQFLDTSGGDTTARLISDYRETLSELLLQNFTIPWTQWAHDMKSKTRNQAHGSPANLIDIYAAVDIPECEGFGLSDFHINGLRSDSLTRHNDSDLSMLKYASSAAHITGKRFTSSETFTWLTEHFRTSFSQCKPDLDLMFVSGVNRVYFHGTTYSPEDAIWPGWKFYASIDMSPSNPLWCNAKPFFKYISRVQSFMQMGKPDNDFLVYLPIYDMWHDLDGRMLMFSIHKMKERAPEFINVVNEISQAGYDMDYISDQLISTTQTDNHSLLTSGGSSYKAIIVPSAHKMPIETLQKLIDLAQQGAKVVFLNDYPTDVPGFSNLNKRRKQFKTLINMLPPHKSDLALSTPLGKGCIITGSNIKNTLKKTAVIPEEIKTKGKLQFIRRKNKDGYFYFIAALKEEDTDIWVSLPHRFKSAVFFHPLDGQIGKASTKQQNGQTCVRIQLKSGQSIILQTYSNKRINTAPWPYMNELAPPFILNNNWSLYFKKSTPAIRDTFTLPQLIPWTKLKHKNAKINMGTAVYSTSFSINIQTSDEWLLDLGDVRETAKIRMNGKDVQTLWSVPYQLFVGPYLKDGLNKIEIEVTGLPANHISNMDKKGVAWRKFKEINFVDLNYQKQDTHIGMSCLPA